MTELNISFDIVYFGPFSKDLPLEAVDTVANIINLFF